MGATESSLADAEGQSHATGRQSVSTGPQEIATEEHSTVDSATILPPTTNRLLLKGIVIGGLSTGKTCLLRRLRGEDPFLLPSGSHKPGDPSRPRKKIMALIPYQPPDPPTNTAELPWSVQLHMVEGTDSLLSVPTKKNKVTLPDVAVVMVDPRRTEAELRTDLETILQNIVSQFLDQVTKSCKGDCSTNAESSSSPTSLHTEEPCKPLSVCVLLNFRDLLPSDQIDKDNKVMGLVKALIQEALQSYRKRVDNSCSSLLTIDCFFTSMKNCYGLTTLHEFLSVPYWKRREYELGLQLHAIRQQQSKPITPLLYKIFLESSLQDEKPNEPSNDRRRNEKEEARHVRKMTERRRQFNRAVIPERQQGVNTEEVPPVGKINVNGRRVITGLSRSEEDRTRVEESPSQSSKQSDRSSRREQREKTGRKGSATRKTQNGHLPEPENSVRRKNSSQKSAVVPKQSTSKIISQYAADPKALDAFFAESEEEDEPVPTKIPLHTQDDNDEDEGDFFFDQGGNRVDLNGGESSSDDEGYVIATAHRNGHSGAKRVSEKLQSEKQKSTTDANTLQKSGDKNSNISSEKPSKERIDTNRQITDAKSESDAIDTTSSNLDPASKESLRNGTQKEMDEPDHVESAREEEESVCDANPDVEPIIEGTTDEDQSSGDKGDISNGTGHKKKIKEVESTRKEVEDDDDVSNGAGKYPVVISSDDDDFIVTSPQKISKKKTSSLSTMKDAKESNLDTSATSTNDTPKVNQAVLAAIAAAEEEGKRMMMRTTDNVPNEEHPYVQEKKKKKKKKKHSEKSDDQAVSTPGESTSKKERKKKKKKKEQKEQPSSSSVDPDDAKEEYYL